MRAALRALGFLLSAVLLVGVSTGIPTQSSVQSPAVQDVLKHIRSVTVQVLVRLEKYSRTLEWYQEVTRTGERGEWKCRPGPWSKEPEAVTIAGTGVIVYSREPDGTYILTNAHVVGYLVQREKLGSPTKPLDEYKLEDLEIQTLPPDIRPRPGALPFRQYYFKLPTEFVEIVHSPGQFYKVYAKIVEFDLSLDAALLQIVQPDGRPARVWGLPEAEFRDRPPQLGEVVYVCGAPLGLPFSLDQGRVNQVELNLGTSGGITWNRQVKLDIAAAPGSSGSGVFDLEGRMIALLHGSLVYAGQFVRGGVLAVPIDLVSEWLTWRGWAFIVYKRTR